MACKGCKKSKRRLLKMIEEKQYTKEELHFMRVCPHGVPAGYKCQTCDKVIEIPADAKLKPEVELEVVKEVSA